MRFMGRLQYQDTLALDLDRNNLAESLAVIGMLRKIMLQLVERTLPILIGRPNSGVFLLVVTEDEPRELQSTKIGLVAQRREKLAQVIEVEAVLRLLELHYLALPM